jgi:hypothetical protein
MKTTAWLVVAASVLFLDGPTATSSEPLARPAGPARYSAPIVAFNRNQSANWAGYNQGLLEKGTPFSSVSGEWIVPTATRKSGFGSGSQSSATWLGIGGGCIDIDCFLTDPTLIQAGTSQDVDPDGKATYSAWWELIPAPSIDIDMAVRPGDRMRCEIAEILPLLWTITLDNLTTGDTFSTTVPYPSTKATVEWIEETPVVISSDEGAQVGPMPNLSKVSFTAARVNGEPAGLVDAEAMELVDEDGDPIAVPSAPLAGGTAFDVCTYQSTCS